MRDFVSNIDNLLLAPASRIQVVSRFKEMLRYAEKGVQQHETPAHGPVMATTKTKQCANSDSNHTPPFV